MPASWTGSASLSRHEDLALQQAARHCGTRAEATFEAVGIVFLAQEIEQRVTLRVVFLQEHIHAMSELRRDVNALRCTPAGLEKQHRVVSASIGIWGSALLQQPALVVGRRRARERDHGEFHSRSVARHASALEQYLALALGAAQHICVGG